MDYTTFYAHWLRFWYTKTGAPHFVNAAAISIMPIPTRPTERQFDGFRMLLNPHDLLQTNLLLDGVWEESVGYWFRRISKDAECVIDIGAHVGHFTLTVWSAAPETAQIYAFEPNPISRNQLKVNLSANQAQNVTVVPMAVGAEDGMLTLYPLNPWEPGATSEFRRYAQRGGFEVAVTTLDGFCQRQPIRRIDSVKMDTEGAEPMILRGMQQGLAEGRYKAMVIAVHPHLWEEPIATEADIRSLERFGYALFRIAGSEATKLDDTIFKDEDILVVHTSRLADLGLPD